MLGNDNSNDGGATNNIANNSNNPNDTNNNNNYNNNHNKTNDTSDNNDTNDTSDTISMSIPPDTSLFPYLGEYISTKTTQYRQKEIYDPNVSIYEYI